MNPATKASKHQKFKLVHQKFPKLYPYFFKNVTDQLLFVCSHQLQNILDEKIMK